MDNVRPDDLVDVVLARERARQLRAQLRRLPEDQRAVVVLAYYAELTESEIADLLDLPIETVKDRMALALEGLRADWERIAAAAREGAESWPGP
jgi:RNA polymerase sigma-70 factor, ECF subfamily